MNAGKKLIGRLGRFIIILLLMAATFSYAMFQGGFVSWFLFYTLIPFLLYSLILNFVPLRIEEVRREIHPAKLSRGDKASVTVCFKSKTWFPLAFLTVKEIGLDNGIAEKMIGGANIFFVGWRRNFSWSYEIPDLQRGVIDFSALQFTFADFFGWTVRHKLIPCKQKLIVYPRLMKLNYREIERRYDQGGSVAPFALLKDTSMVTSLRDYQAGDRFSWIHWKSFAKDETLRTKDFEVRHSQEVLLILDATVRKHFEEAVDFSASMLQTLAGKNEDVSFYIAGEEQFFYPQVKRTQLEKVMRQLAMVKANDNKNIESLLLKEGKMLDSFILLFTGELTDSLNHFFKYHARKTKGIICFVAGTDEALLRQMESGYCNVKVVPVAKTMFWDVFTEVSRP